MALALRNVALCCIHAFGVLQVIKDLLEKVTKAYVACGKCMLVKLPLKSKTRQALSSIDPGVRGHLEAVTQL